MEDSNVQGDRYVQHVQHVQHANQPQDQDQSNTQQEVNDTVTQTDEPTLQQLVHPHQQNMKSGKITLVNFGFTSSKSQQLFGNRKKQARPKDVKKSIQQRLDFDFTPRLTNDVKTTRKIVTPRRRISG